MMRRAVILFARTPEAEACAKSLSRQAIALFENLIAAWLRAAPAIDATAFIACDRSARERFATIAPDVPRQYIDQCGATFGARVANAAARVRRYDTILISGIDAPPPPDLPLAFAALEGEQADGAIAPASDGGINVIAFREAPLELLATLTPGDGTIAGRCRAWFPQVYEFARTSDVDSSHDLVRAALEVAWIRFRDLLAACVAAPFATQTLMHAATRPRSLAVTRGPPLR